MANDFPQWPPERVAFSASNTEFRTPSDLTDGDQLVYVNGVLMGKLLENETLLRQAASNTKEQFANSPDLKDALLRDILLGPAQLYEALRRRHNAHP